MPAPCFWVEDPGGVLLPVIHVGVFWQLEETLGETEAKTGIRPHLCTFVFVLPPSVSLLRERPGCSMVLPPWTVQLKSGAAENPLGKNLSHSPRKGRAARGGKCEEGKPRGHPALVFLQEGRPSWLRRLHAH